MKIFIETERLILREIEEKDVQDLFEMDSDPSVHLYLENPVKTLEEIQKAIVFIQNQYKENGIGRWAVVDKTSDECLGWAGLKFYREPLNGRSNIYELGYRFKQKHWGKGYATESSKAVLEYGFQNLDIDIIFAMTHPGNKDSQHVLSKLGFASQSSFDYDGDLTDWFELTKEDWENEK